MILPYATSRSHFCSCLDVSHMRIHEESYLLNKSGPPGLSSVVLFKTVKVLVEQFESFSSEGDTIGVSSLMRAPNGSFSVTGVRMGLFKGDSTLRVSLHGKYYIYISLYMQISIVKFNAERLIT